MGKKTLLGCLLLVVLGFLAFFGVGYWFYRNFTGKTPEQVAQLAEELAPGARPPQGFVASMGMDIVGMKMASFENKATRQHILLIQAPVDSKDLAPTREELVPSLKVTLNQEDHKRARASTQESALELKGQTESFPCLKRLVTERGESKWEWNLLAWAPTDRQHVVMIQAESPQALPDDQFVRDFMLTLRLKPYCRAK